ncbi:MAG TPA: ATP-binding protein, partial [Steroidobacteraceae bacterium]
LFARERQYEIRDFLAAALRAADERARLHEEALRARAAAESANRMKDEFLAVVSHELRTPLNAILGWATLLNGGRLDTARTRQANDAIVRNARAQAQLIEDLLDISRIISGTLRLDVQRVDLVQVIERALTTVMPAAEAKGLRIFKVFDPNAGPVSGDPGRLQQIVWNLLSNAVKFTPKGGRIQVLLERINSHVEIRVSDSGQGIATGFLELVFERFRQVDSSTTRAHGGLGLGLSIVRQLVDLHGGNVIAESAGPGKGATFVVRLPLAAVQRAPALESAPEPESRDLVSPPAAASLLGLTVLAIDDELESLRVLSESLRLFGAQVTTANSALQGLELFRAGPVDVVICDIGMPQEDGYSFIRRMRALEQTAGRVTPAIALTAYARGEDRMKTLAAGFQIHVAKPANPLELVQVVAGLARVSAR